MNAAETPTSFNVVRDLCDSEPRHPPTTFVSFATGEFRHRQIYLSRSALKVGIDRVIIWNDDRLRKEKFFEDHLVIFNYKTGFGCWLWKPYIIYYELSRLNDDEFLIYWDVGRERYPNRFELSLTPLLSWCSDNDGILPGVCLPQYGPNKRWTKRDCFVAMNCDAPTYWDHPQVQATFSIWQKNPRALAFVEEWLTWCQRPEVITDAPNRLGLPNFEEFVAHRHDQSVLTNLVVKHHIRYLANFGRLLPDDGDKDLNNAIDNLLERKIRIRWRVIRKPFQVWTYKLTSPVRWRRKFIQIFRAAARRFNLATPR